MKDDVPRHTNKLSKGNIVLCTHLVVTEVQITVPFMHHYSLWLTFWRSDLLKCLIHGCAEVHKYVPQHSQEDLILWACCFSRYFLPFTESTLYLKTMMYSEKLSSSSIHNTFFTAFQCLSNPVGLETLAPASSTLLLRISVHIGTAPSGTAVIRYVVGLRTTKKQSIFLICACIHDAVGKKKASSKVNK